MTEPRLARPADLPSPGGTIFMLGVAGAGMRALARALVAAGYTVAGSDRDPAAAAPLAAEGIRVHPEADTSPIGEADLVVHSSALGADHPALRAARAAGVPVMKRARALGALVNDHRLAAVAGTHGKTTVTAMLALAAERAGMDPLALVGGRVAAWGGNARLGAGRLAVVEADEYDRSFLELDPDLAVVTSVEAEHLDVYGDVDALRAAFGSFAARAASVLLCADDEGARELREVVERKRRAVERAGPPGGGPEFRTYGFAPNASYRLEVIEADRAGQSCRLHGPEGPVAFHLGAPGAHNAQNAAAALAAASWLGADSAALARALEDFRGADRRLQVLHESAELVVVDDYAHHPTEVKAGLEALRSAWPGRRLVVVFQPHLYTRTRDQAVGFSAALAGADRAYVLPIYPAREAPIPGVTRELILTAARRGLEPLEAGGCEALLRVDAPTVLAFMGAGDVTELAHDAARAAATGRRDALGG